MKRICGSTRLGRPTPIVLVWAAETSAVGGDSDRDEGGSTTNSVGSGPPTLSQFATCFGERSGRVLDDESTVFNAKLDAVEAMIACAMCVEGLDDFELPWELVDDFDVSLADIHHILCAQWERIRDYSNAPI